MDATTATAVAIAAAANASGERGPDAAMLSEVRRSEQASADARRLQRQYLRASAALIAAVAALVAAAMGVFPW